LEVERRRNRLGDPSVPVSVIQVPIALGANKPGVDRGARELDNQLRARLERRDFPDILNRLQPSQRVAVLSLDDAGRREQLDQNAMHAQPIAEACERVGDLVRAALAAGNLALVLGGDHALSIGSLAGASSLGRLGVIWVDAHGDINTPQTTPSGHVHGMPLAAALGYGPGPLVELGNRFDLFLDDLVYIGVRDLDPGERDLLRQSSATVYPMSSIDTLGIDGVVEEAIRRLHHRGVDAVHLSIDLDVLDPSIFRATGTPVHGGLTYREVRRMCTMLRGCDLPIVSVDVVELNPDLDSAGDYAAIAAGLTAAILGEDLA
jgi:arginase